MAVVTYKCPNCDGGLIFDPDAQQFRCEYCSSLFTQQQLEEQAPDAQRESTDPAGTAVVYSCPSCGAEIVTDATTAATTCYYCHNPVVLQGRVEGAFQPDGVIPFAIPREEAVAQFLAWARKKWFIPPAFFNKKQIDTVSGVYFPCWVVDCDATGSLLADGTQVRSWTAGDVEYTETRHYRIAREGQLHFEDIYKNALNKANRQLVEGVHPFDHTATKDFSMGYLLGFQAEQRDISRESLAAEVEQDVAGYSSSLLQDTVQGYTTVLPLSSSAQLTQQHWCYTLLPVWTLTYKGHDGTIYYYTMNGQTGKVCGKLPLDKGRLALLFAAVAVPAFLLLLMIGGLLL